MMYQGAEPKGCNALGDMTRPSTEPHTTAAPVIWPPGDRKGNSPGAEAALLNPSPLNGERLGEGWTMATLAEKLRQARVRKKLSMSAVSGRSFKVCGADPRGLITQGYISRLESGKETNPSMLKIKTLSRIYGIKSGSLF